MSLPEPYYDRGGITVFCADCRNVLPYVHADLLMTDPPYGINAGDQRRQRSRGKLALPTDYGPNDWDLEPVDAGLLADAIARTRHAIVFGGNYFEVPPSSRWLVWDKDNTGDFADCELAWTNLPGAVRRIRYRWNGMLQEHGGRHKEPRFHPTQKPVAVMRWAIQQAPDDCAVVLDPFMGVGSTLLAARDLGRRAIGIEREEKYVAIAVKRLAQQVFDFGGNA